MEEWKEVKLKEVLKEVNEKNKDEKVKRVLSVTNSKGFVSQDEYFEGAVHSANISNYKIIRKNQFAYNPSRVNVGSIDILKNYEEGALSPMYVVFEVDTTKLLPEYFNYYFQTNRFYENVKNNTQGSVRNSLNFKALVDFDYLLPPIEEQEKIVGILKTIDSIIEKYESLLEEKNQFIKSQFVEMFENKNYEKICGKELFSFSSGKFLEANKRLEKGIPVYGGNGIAWYTDEPLIDYNTIVIGRVGAYCGNVKLIKEPVWITDNAIFIKQFKRNVYNIDFLYYMMELIDFSRFAQFSGQPKITQKPLEEFEYVIPPIELQNQFSEFVKLIDKQKIKLEKLIANYKTLKKGLMQQLLTGKVKVNV